MTRRWKARWPLAPRAGFLLSVAGELAGRPSPDERTHQRREAIGGRSLGLSERRRPPRRNLSAQGPQSTIRCTIVSRLSIVLAARHVEQRRAKEQAWLSTRTHASTTSFPRPRPRGRIPSRRPGVADPWWHGIRLRVRRRTLLEGGPSYATRSGPPGDGFQLSGRARARATQILLRLCSTNSERR